MSPCSSLYFLMTSMRKWSIGQDDTKVASKVTYEAGRTELQDLTLYVKQKDRMCLIFSKLNIIHERSVACKNIRTAVKKQERTRTWH